jgi:hypothetical protein
VRIPYDGWDTEAFLGQLGCLTRLLVLLLVALTAWRVAWKVIAWAWS